MVRLEKVILLRLLLIATTGLWRVQCGSLMLWPLMEILQWLFGVTVAERFHEMRILSGAMHARNHVTVVAEKVQSLMRIEQQFEATVTLNERKEEKSMRGTWVRICIFHLNFVFLLHLRSSLHILAAKSHSIQPTKATTQKKLKIEMCRVLTVKRSGQHGIAAKISYAYIVPSTNDEPFHFLAQNLNTTKTRRKPFCK